MFKQRDCTDPAPAVATQRKAIEIAEYPAEAFATSMPEFREWLNR